VIRAGLSALAVLALAGPAGAAPVVDQLVVFRSGKAIVRSPATDATRVRTGERRCRVPRATPLAALVRSRVARLRVKDFSRACDPASLFVSAIGPDRNRGRNGWVYKVGNRQGTTAASTGRLRKRVRITWFYCAFADGGCQRTLAVRVRREGGGTVTARVTAYDDEGRGEPVARARVRAGAVSARTDARGRATLALPPGAHRVHAEKRGHIRSFDERVRVG
jgi:hypothetical protein